MPGNLPKKTPDDQGKKDEKKPTYVEVATSVAKKFAGDGSIRETLEFTAEAARYLIGRPSSYEEMLAAEKIRNETAAAIAQTEAAGAYGKGERK